ncbi:g3391 [Coccomyxa viridis]|uniref:G3391 protein n=1 Tax=Coccomyxa viridis TaxID=1274662 RepID=A0ABP1FUK9_9CHLO
MEDRVRELEEKLKKSEDQRQKLKDNLKFFKEKATNTQELLRQHVQLQGDADKKDEELSQLRQDSSGSDSMRAVLARLDRVQQTSQDAKAASQAAAAAARKAEHDVMNLQKQNSQLRDRVKDLENRQKVSSEEIGRVKVQSAALCDREPLKRKVDSLEHQLTALLQQQRHAHEQLTQWQQAFGTFAQHVAPPLLGSTPVSQERQTGKRKDSLEPQHRKEQERPSKKMSRDAGCLDVKDSSKGSVPHGPEPMSDAEGTALHMASGSEGDRNSIGTVAGPDGNAAAVPTGPSAAHVPAPAPLQDWSSSRAVAGHEALLPSPFDRAPQDSHQHPQPGKALESSASGNAMEREAAPPSAMEFVESWLIQLLDRDQPAVLCSTVAAELATAITSGACLMPCVVAGFESTLLRIVSSPPMRVPASHASSSNTASAGSRLAGSPHMVQPKQQSTAQRVLSCAVELDQRLTATGSQHEDLLTLLEQQLHQGSLQEEDAWEVEACILAAAAAQLYRLTDNQQALRVLLYDVLMSQEEANAQLLLRVSAAVLAWPTPLEDVASSDDLLGQAVLATIRDMCTEVFSREERQGSEAETAADTDSGTSSAIVVDRGVQTAARALIQHVQPEVPQASIKASTQQGSGRRWSSLKGILEDALRSGIAMAETPKHESAAEEQWHAVACTVQLAVRCLGIGHCTEKAKEHGILDTLKAVIHTLEVPLADGGAVGTQSGVAAEVELI